MCFLKAMDIRYTKKAKNIYKKIKTKIKTYDCD